jgi:predicted DCC family thiol-disulfide oxidoreductase YuxK
MKGLAALRDAFLRVDARSLGLFRLAMGLCLLGDLLRRAAWIDAFYTNDGVLPNYAHLTMLGEGARVWSVLHAFSTSGEARTAFAVIFLVYAGFLAGVRTRTFHVLSLLSLLSLGGRDVLLGNAGDDLALALLLFTAFLPLGSRFSIDALSASFAARDEKDAAALNDRRRPDPDAARAPGWTPTSLAAAATLAQVALVTLVMGLLAQRSAPSALSAWTRALHLSLFAVPALLAVPFALRLTRGLAAGLLLFTGATLAVSFSFGLLGWTLCASSALLVPRATWDRIEGHPIPRRARTVIYDADCGVCLLICRLLRRFDLRHDLTFRGNDDLDGLPPEVTPDLVQRTVVVLDPAGKIATRARAVAGAIQALPFGWAVAGVMVLPGVVDVLDDLYDSVAVRRMDISVALGKGACGLPPPPGAEVKAPDPAPPPSTRLRRGIVAALREIAVATVFAAALAQTVRANQLAWPVPRPAWLEPVAAWPRLLARWDVLAAPPAEDAIVVVDAQTRSGRSVDLLTGRPPELASTARRGPGLGQLWSDYLDRVLRPEHAAEQRYLREYFDRGGPAFTPDPDDPIVGYDVLLVRPPRDAPRAWEVIFTQAKGGRGLR